jgi:hypothetical protein
VRGVNETVAAEVGPVFDRQIEARIDLWMDSIRMPYSPIRQAATVRKSCRISLLWYRIFVDRVPGKETNLGGGTVCIMAGTTERMRRR